MLKHNMAYALSLSKYYTNMLRLNKQEQQAR